MKKITFLILVSLITNSMTAQVAIGTTTPSPSSILELASTTQTFVPPRMTNSQMLAITNPLVGSIVYNLSNDGLFMRTNLGWENISRTSNPTITLNKDFTGVDTVIQTVNNIYTKFPLNTSEVVSITSSAFTVVGNGDIKINAAGTFIMNAAFSVENVPIGDRKFVIGIYKNNVLLGYPTRGTIVLSAIDSWGSSGVLVENFVVGDIISFRYVLNNGGIPLDALNFNIGIAKLK